MESVLPMSEGNFIINSQNILQIVRSMPSGDITIDTCFDADRLDLVRCGIQPDPRGMATERGKELARQMRRDKSHKD